MSGSGLKKWISVLAAIILVMIQMPVGSYGEAVSAIPGDDGIPIDADHFPEESFRRLVSEETYD